MDNGCSVDGCERRHYARGFCNAHYQRARLGYSVDGPIQPAKGPRPREERTCAVTGCGYPTRRASGYCDAHDFRLRTLGDVQADRPVARKRDKTKPYTDRKGYVQIYRPGHPSAWSDGWIPEHRLVMCDVLGRALADDEHVHHRNGVRADNRPENLELWTRSHPDGQRVEDVLRWAREFVARYDD